MEGNNDFASVDCFLFVNNSCSDLSYAFADPATKLLHCDWQQGIGRSGLHGSNYA